MYSSKRGIAVLALLAGCSSDLGMPAPGAETTGTDPAQSPGDGQEPGVDAEQPTMVVNDDGTVTIRNPDGSTQTLDEEGNVVAETPPTMEAGPSDDGAAVDDGTPPVKPPTTSSGAACEPGTPKVSSIPRLTNRQYDNTVRDLIDVDLQLSVSTLQAESKGAMDARSWQAYQDAAATIASTIVSNDAARAKVVTCTTADAACARTVITDFGARVFRRPLEATEVARFEAMFADATLTETGSFDEQLQVVLEALFQSPYFLTRAELSEVSSTDPSGGTRYALTDFELASRLSYMLWDTTPDEELSVAAAQGTLTQGTGLADQARRMLQDPRAKGLVERLHMDYLRMGANTRWTGYTRDAAKYPAYSPTQVDALARETLLVAESVVLGGGSFAELMTTTKGFVNADTAPLYGLNSASYGADLVEADLGAERPGILTRAGFLAANSYGNRTSPIHRGAFIMKDVLCTPMGDPSPNAVTTPLPNDPGLVTNREKTQAQTSIAADCVACHDKIINPAGFALERFDAVGSVQTEDNGAPVDTKAEVLVDGQFVSVTGAADLMAAIGSASSAQRCYTENWVAIAYNRVLSPEDVCTVDELATKMADASYSVLDLVTDLATVESFRFRALETAEVAQ